MATTTSKVNSFKPIATFHISISMFLFIFIYFFLNFKDKIKLLLKVILVCGSIVQIPFLNG